MMAPAMSQSIEDLRPFCDLGTEPEVAEYASHVEVRWIRNHINHLTLFSVTDGVVTVTDNDSAVLSYREFLASPAMSNLRQIANQIRILYSKRRGESKRVIRGQSLFTADWYVDPEVTFTDGDSADRRPSSPLMADIVDRPASEDYTEVYFLTAPAGQGKSSALQRLHMQQSMRYLSGDSDVLTFFVDAQGRGLAKLGDVLSRELNELRVFLPYGAIFSLVREGLITLIVDGFDELIGARGAKDGAFSSLTSFLERLEGRGRVIAAARSSFFTQEYQSRPNLLSGSSGRHQIYQMELEPWTAVERREFLALAQSTSAHGVVSQKVETRFREIESGEAARFLNRPLFSRDVLIALIEDPTLQVGENIYEFMKLVVAGYITRECSDKLIGRDGQPILNAGNLVLFYEEFANEMWQSEARDLELSTVRLQMALLTEDWGVTVDNQKILAARLGYLPFIAMVEDSTWTVAFEHELFFAHFVSSSLYQSIFMSDDSAALVTLARSKLTPEEAAMVIARLPSNEHGRYDALERLGTLGGSRHPRQGQIQENCGSLAVALLRSWVEDVGAPVKARLRNLTFDGDDFAGIYLADSDLTGCTLNRVDLRNCKIEGSAERTDIYSAIVDDQTTRLSLAGLDQESPILQVLREAGGEIVGIYSVEERNQVLEAIGQGIPQEAAPRFAVSPQISDLVTNLCKAFDEVNPVGTGHHRYGHFFQGPTWKMVRDNLITYGLLREDPPRPTSGPRQTFYRRNFRTADLLGALVSGSGDADIDAFWASVQK